MKKILFYLYFLLLSAFTFAQNEQCEKVPESPLDPFQYIKTDILDDGQNGVIALFYLLTPDEMVLDVQCLYYNEKNEIVEQTFKDVKELIWSNKREVLLYLNTDYETVRAVGYIDWNIPDKEAEKIANSNGSTVWSPNKFPIRFKLKYAEDMRNKN